MRDIPSSHAARSETDCSLEPVINSPFLFLLDEKIKRKVLYMLPVWKKRIVVSGRKERLA